MENLSFEKTNLLFFRSSVNSLLVKDDRVKTETAKFITEQLVETFLNTKEELKISYPINFRPSDLLNDAHLIREMRPGMLEYAFFRPNFDGNGKVNFGELVLWQPSLIAFSKTIERQEKTPLTPWKFIHDVAHEMRHAYQCDQKPNEVVEDKKIPYEAQRMEYDAEDYAFKYLSNQKPQNFQDRVEKFFELHSIREKMKSIKKERKKLGIE